MIEQAFRYSLCALLLVMFVLPVPVNAQSIIRDSEIESYLSEWFTPIFKANGMSPEQVNIILVQNSEVNAFVAGGANIFLYTGLIHKTDNPAELIGVMAHELGHITGGHLVRGRQALEQASYEAILGTILGVGAAVASGDAAAAGAGSLAGNSIAQRRFLAKTRTFESSADQAALVSMERAGLSPEGLLSFMRKLEGQELVPANQQSEYVRSHPLTRNRITRLSSKVEESKNLNKAHPAKWDAQHRRMKAKLLGFIQPEHVAWTYDDRDNSIPAQYAKTLAHYKQNRIEQALQAIDALIQLEPDNPYFYELKGQMLVDFGRVPQALTPYKRTVLIRPQDGLLRMALAHAQLESADDNQAVIQEAIENLKIATREEPRSTRTHRLLATAYGRLGQDAYAKLHLAEEALLQGRKNYAKQQAQSALIKLPKNTAASQRAQDILVFVK